MGAAVAAALLGLLIVVLVVGIPYLLTHRHMRSQHDPVEAQAYQEATGRSAELIGAGERGRRLRPDSDAGRAWLAAHHGVHPETGERDPKTGQAGWPDGTG
jgi:hypothetical protein